MVLDFADRARHALLEFLRGSNLGWGAEELGVWLSTTYADASRRTGESADEARCTITVDGEVMPVAKLEDAIDEARRVILDMMRATIRSPWAAIEEIDMTPLVVASRDSMSGIGYVAVDESRMTLVDRVGALFFADFLTRPHDYKDHLHICESCGEVSFVWAVEHLAICGRTRDARLISDVVQRERTDAIAPSGITQGREEREPEAAD
jgi:hypothetical protein